ncbi:hypothetical protein AAFF_G00167320 [Aldrovandia affinis]|uniref:Uncharacterized protein n=1 Tax=Aldrovandia affinis TaxID=143900 RepID=A0AAD7RM15_9TELE|nr:hypothetical protein AAFF_G00167320 [Aldrovandia affinis]
MGGKREVRGKTDPRGLFRRSSGIGGVDPCDGGPGGGELNPSPPMSPRTTLAQSPGNGPAVTVQRARVVSDEAMAMYRPIRGWRRRKEGLEQPRTIRGLCLTGRGGRGRGAVGVSIDDPPCLLPA